MNMISHLFVANGLLVAFAVVGLIMWGLARRLEVPHIWTYSRFGNRDRHRVFCSPS